MSIGADERVDRGAVATCARDWLGLPTINLKRLQRSLLAAALLRAAVLRNRPDWACAQVADQQGWPPLLIALRCITTTDDDREVYAH